MKYLIAAGALVATVAASNAEEVRPALLYDFGGRFDASFNESAYNGAERFKAETGIEYTDFEIQNDAQREQALRNFAQRGFEPIIAVGFAQAQAVERVAKEFPEVKFGIVDMVVDLPNVRSTVFREHEASYLAGQLAVLRDDRDEIFGFVGGMDVPLIRRFACGYIGGIRSLAPDAEVIVSWTGTTGDAWNNPTRGAELARAQIGRGANVIYAVAGGTSIGVLQAAADEGAFSIGEASNQNHLHPGSVLTSVTKGLDIAVFNAFMDAKNGEWTTGIVSLGLAEDGVAWTLDEHNRPIISDDMVATLEETSAKIEGGELSVHDFMTQGECPY